jgi:hypothetical protein
MLQGVKGRMITSECRVTSSETLRTKTRASLPPSPKFHPITRPQWPKTQLLLRRESTADDSKSGNRDTFPQNHSYSSSCPSPSRSFWHRPGGDLSPCLHLFLTFPSASTSIMSECGEPIKGKCDIRTYAQHLNLGIAHHAHQGCANARPS